MKKFMGIRRRRFSGDDRDRFVELYVRSGVTQGEFARTHLKARIAPEFIAQVLDHLRKPCSDRRPGPAPGNEKYPDRLSGPGKLASSASQSGSTARPQLSHLTGLLHNR